MINILLVDDHELVRTGIEHLLRAGKDMNVVGVGASGEEAIELTEQLNPDVILMDINMPGMGGIEACRKINHKHPQVKIVALSVYADGPYPHQLLSQGADGYLSKNCPPSELMAAVRTVHGGGKYLSQDVANKMALASLPGQTTTPFDQLSYRELQFVLMTLQGKSMQQMGDLLNISPKTVTTYRYRAFEKLGVKNGVELTKLAVQFDLARDELIASKQPRW
ncbi:response regulator [Methylomagnum ishizawai]|uniref:response regulator n=1 Tax=Methylomagnum ishizawai TaxID=1760988 RepID=UPI001C32EE1C|nr:response regulator [Methylomagnum ishizawai]BBL73630.1 DNA-binding response regulator [Methylomagnum ishizawai]